MKNKIKNQNNDKKLIKFAKDLDSLAIRWIAKDGLSDRSARAVEIGDAIDHAVELLSEYLSNNKNIDILDYY